MALTKQDLTNIDFLMEKRVTSSEQRLLKAITDSEDRLALAVAEGFADVDTRFDTVDQRLSHLERDVSKMKLHWVDKVERPEIASLRKRVTLLEQKVFPAK